MVAKYLDLTGQRYGRLTVAELFPERTSGGKARWLCRCECGATTTVDARNLRSGSITSCGCYRRDRAEHLTARHRQSKTPEHNTWRQMRARCTNARHQKFPDYGGRGITVCSEWNSFERFLADMGPRPSPKHSIDRKDNDGPYAPSNCRWATSPQQRRNTRTNTRLTHRGRTLTLTDWAIDLGLAVNTLSRRLTKGWSVERALTTPTFPQQSAAARQRFRSPAPPE